MDTFLDSSLPSKFKPEEIYNLNISITNTESERYIKHKDPNNYKRLWLGAFTEEF